ncbi:MAG: SGNH/GDSL hydrolase family protein [Planctomycetota bacterium]|jgi:lysophospholipase L1-like esterase
MRIFDPTNSKSARAVLLTLALIAIAEAGVRVRAWRRHGSTATVAPVYDNNPQTGRRLKPGATLAGQQRRLSINRWGFRGPEIPRQKPPRTIRIAALGESTTFGLEASSDDAIWLAQLVRNLNNKPLPQKFDAVNAAIPGNTIGGCGRLFQAEVAAFHPDIVIVLNAAADIAAHTKRQFRMYARDKAEPGVVARTINERSLLLNLTRANTAWIRSILQPPIATRLLDHRGVAEFESKAKAIVEETRRGNATAIVCTYPRAFGDPAAPTSQHLLARTAIANNPDLTIDALNDAFDRYNQALRRIATSSNSILVDLDRLVPKRADFFVDSIHLNDAGHKLVADLITATVEDLLQDQLASRIP